MGTLTEKRPDATSGSGKRMKMSARDAVGLIRRAKRRGAKVDVKPALAKPTGPVQKKAGCSLCAMAGGSAPETAPAGYSCPLCSGKGGAAGPALEAPRDSVQHKGAGTADAAEAQADALGARIGAELGGAGSVSSGPIPSGVRSVAERYLGVGLGGTELRADAGAHSRTASVGALAMTEGSTVSFGAGQLSTSTAAGRSLIGHELTHVAQQRAHGTAARQGFFGDDGDDAGLADGAGALGSGGSDALSGTPAEPPEGGMTAAPVLPEGEGSPEITGVPSLQDLPPVVTPYIDPADGNVVVPLPGDLEVRVPFRAVAGVGSPSCQNSGGSGLCAGPTAGGAEAGEELTDPLLPIPVQNPSVHTFRARLAPPVIEAQPTRWTCWAATASSVLQSEKIVPSGLASAKPMDIALFAEARKCTATADRVRKMVLPNGNDGPVFRWLQIGFSGGGNRDVFQTASKELAAAIKMLIDARRYVYMIYDAYVSSDGFVGMHAVVVFGYTWVASSTGAVLGFTLDLMDPNRGEIKTEEAASGYKNPKVGIAALGADSLAGCTHFCSCYDPCRSQTPGPGDCVEWRGVDCDSCRGNVR